MGLHRPSDRSGEQAERDVLGRVAHELRHPLAVIVMKVAMMKRRDDPEGLRRDYDAVERNAARLAGMIQDAVDFSEVASGRLRISATSRSHDVVEMLEEALHDCAAPERVRVRLTPDRVLPELPCDRDRILKVLDHLIGNAIKFTPEPGRITVAVEVDDDDVIFRVEDEGIGVPTEDVSQLFEPPCAERRPKRPGEGAGLGLYNSRGFVEAHGGRIWVETLESGGSCFAFALPRTRGTPRLV